MRFVATCARGAGLCILPRPENDFRPLALRHGPLALLSSLLIVAKVLAFGIIALVPAQAELSTITTARIIQLTNNERIDAGLAPLEQSQQLMAAAAEKADHMISEDYFAHISPSGVTPWFWIKKHGYTYQVAGENLAIDFFEAEDVVAAWMASPTHKANIIHPDYAQTGVAVLTGEFQGSNSTVVVHMFGLPVGQVPPNPLPVVDGTNEEESPAPTLAPSITPPIVTPKPDTTSPRVPRIVLLSDVNVLQNSLNIQIEGEPNSDVEIYANEFKLARTNLPASGALAQVVDLSSIADGNVELKARSIDGANNESAFSDAIRVTKDTQGPELAREDLSFLLSPATDSGRVLLSITTHDFDSLLIDDGNEKLTTNDAENIPLSISSLLKVSAADSVGNQSVINDINIEPQFSSDDSIDSASELQPPRRMSRLARTMGFLSFIVISILLILAVIINIKIQRPSLITHALFVIIISSVLFVL